MVNYEDFRKHCLDCACTEEKECCTTKTMFECAMKMAYEAGKKEGDANEGEGLSE